MLCLDLDFLLASPWNVYKVSLAVVLPDLEPDLEHYVLLLVLRLRGPGCGLALGLLERLGEADKDLVHGLWQETSEHVTLDHVTLGPVTVPHGGGEGKTRLLLGLSLAPSKEDNPMNPELGHPGPET